MSTHYKPVRVTSFLWGGGVENNIRNKDIFIKRMKGHSASQIFLRQGIDVDLRCTRVFSM